MRPCFRSTLLITAAVANHLATGVLGSCPRTAGWSAATLCSGPKLHNAMTAGTSAVRVSRKDALMGSTIALVFFELFVACFMFDLLGSRGAASYRLGEMTMERVLVHLLPLTIVAVVFFQAPLTLKTLSPASP